METVDRRRKEEEKRSADPSRHVRTTRSECVALRLAALAFQRSAAKGAQNLVNAVLSDDVVHDVLDDVIVMADAVDLRDEGEAVVRRLRERIAACSDLATRLAADTQKTRVVVGDALKQILLQNRWLRGRVSRIYGASDLDEAGNRAWAEAKKTLGLTDLLSPASSFSLTHGDVVPNNLLLSDRDVFVDVGGAIASIMGDDDGRGSEKKEDESSSSSSGIPFSSK